MVRWHLAAITVAWSLSERRAGGVLGCKVCWDRGVLNLTARTWQAVGAGR